MDFCLRYIVRMLQVKLRRLLILAVLASCICVLWSILQNYTLIPLVKRTSDEIKYSGFTNDTEKYKFIINHPQSCMLEKVTLVLMVHSACKNYQRRNNIRKTWGTVKKSGMFNIKYFFVLGYVERHQESVLSENNLYSDIIQQDFVDAYRNLTLKNQMAMKWPSIYCKTAQFIVKLDDDIMVNIHHLTQFLREKLKQSPIKNFLFCHVFYKEVPHRYAFPHGKWALTYEEYPSDRFPPFCRGTAYILSPDAAVKLWRGSYEIPPIFIDDVFMTGIVREHVDIEIQHGVAPYRMGPSLADVYRERINVGDALFFIPESERQMQNWDFVWNKIVESTGVL